MMSKYEEIERKRAICDYNMSVLKLWEHAKQNLPEDIYNEIKAFTFSDEFLTEEQNKENAKYMGTHYCGFNFHNAVRLNSGDLQEIPLIKRPNIPGFVKVEIK